MSMVRPRPLLARVDTAHLFTSFCFVLPGFTGVEKREHGNCFHLSFPFRRPGAESVIRRQIENTRKFVINSEHLKDNINLHNIQIRVAPPKIPITKVVGIRCFSPFWGENQALFGRFFVEVSHGTTSQKPGVCMPQVPPSPLKFHMNHEKWIFSWISAGVFLTQFRS